MNSDNYQHTSTSHKENIDNLHNIFNRRQVIQSYPQRDSYHLYFKPNPSQQQSRFNGSYMLIQNQNNESIPKKHKKFLEDDILGELHSTNIVENYAMLDERDEIYQSYENILKGRGQKPIYINQNMLASSSQNNDVPSRNSSLSSLSEKNNILNVNLNSSFDRHNFLQKSYEKNQLKNSYTSNKRSLKKYYQVNSQNEMDIENSPYQNSYLPREQHDFKSSLKIPPSVFMQQKNITLDRNNAFINPQINSNHFPIFKRTDIDDERQKQERLQKIQKLQQIGCNCKKSKCLKMYCQCFNLQIFCNENCNCCGCCNQETNQEHQKAVLDALTRNPKAFNEATQQIDATFNLGVELNEVKKGCKCKKTKCQKKYCQCFNLGQACGKFCKCEGCENC